MNIPGYHIAIGNATDTGKVREQNEDYMSHFDTSLGYCIIVCDGMGGHAAGDVASQNAVTAIRQFLQDPQNGDSPIPGALRNAIEFANFRLRELVSRDPSLKGMGTTCVLALIRKGLLYMAHAGDSRIYLVRNGNTEQLTKDHSSVQKLIDMGILTEAEAELSDKRNQISKAIGIFDKADPTVTDTPVPLHEHDTVLLCTDGLTGHVGKNQIGQTVQAEKDVQQAALQLIALANEGGGSDNITVQVISYTGKTAVVKRKGRRRKRVIVLLLFLILVALGFIGYDRYNKHGNSISGQKGNDSTGRINTPAVNNAGSAGSPTDSKGRKPVPALSGKMNDSTSQVIPSDKPGRKRKDDKKPTPSSRDGINKSKRDTIGVSPPSRSDSVKTNKNTIMNKVLPAVTK